MFNSTTSAAQRAAVPITIVRALWAKQTWWALVHLVTGSFLGFVGGTTLLVLASLALAGVWTVVIAFAAAGGLFYMSAVLADFQRSRHAAFLGLRWSPGANDPMAAFTPSGIAAHFRRPKTWRQLAYHVIASGYGPFAFAITIAFWTAGVSLAVGPLFPTSSLSDSAGESVMLCAAGLAILVAAPWVTRGLAVLDAAMARPLLGASRSEELELRVNDLAASRNSTVDAADAERRRIERDLHDGAQQRLTSLAMNLGIAQATLTDPSDPSARAIAQAHDEAKQTLVELRQLVRGLHPAVLEDRGLDAALSAVAARSPVPVRLKVDMDRRVARDVEAVAYFVVSEALTNVAKHASALCAVVEIELREDMLYLRITDDGTGGADPARGTGLRGLADRVRSVDGTFRLTSPAGGLTIIEAELPCAS